MPRLSPVSELDAYCWRHGLGWALDERAGPHGTVSACVFTWPEKEIVATAGPAEGGRAARNELVTGLLEQLRAR